MDTNEMQSGPETDLLVARAMEVPAWINGGEVYIGFNFRTATGVTGGEREFSPSTDWNDAMLAVSKEQRFLFDLGRGYHIAMKREFWIAKFWDAEPVIVNGVGSTTRHEEFEAHADTGPLAICRALLMLPQKPNQPPRRRGKAGE